MKRILICYSKHETTNRVSRLNDSGLDRLIPSSESPLKYCLKLRVADGSYVPLNVQRSENLLQTFFQTKKLNC
jgi:hypothetical protein